MSYEKITGTVKTIRFYYLFDEISRKVEKTSSYKAQGTPKGDGQPDYTRVQLSVDELDFLKECMEEGLLEIFDLFFHLITSDSITHDTGVVLDGAVNVNAGSFVVGQGYTITFAGTTNWGQVGADDTAIGTSFIAIAAGSGTGAADESPFGTYCSIKDNEKYRTINLDIIDKKITGAVVDYVLYKWYFLKNLKEDAALHLVEYQKALREISERTIALRQY
jgi:hypothetical protein